MADTRSTDHSAVHHEPSDVNTGGVFRFAFGLLVAGGAIYLFVWLLVLYLAARDARPGTPEVRKRPCATPARCDSMKVRATSSGDSAVRFTRPPQKVGQ